MRLNNRSSTGPARETHAQPQIFHAAFTLPELLIVLLIIVILVGMIFPPLARPNEKAYRINCVNNLKNVGLAFRIFATDNNNRLPWDVPDPKDTNAPTHILYSSDPTTYLLPLTNELSTPKIVKCPEDKRATEATNWTQFTRANLSYFISPDAAQTYPQSFLAGDRNITNKNGRLTPGLHALSTQPSVPNTQSSVLSTLNSIGWDEDIHKYQGNACMADGSVQQLSSARLRDQLRNTGQTNKSIILSVP